MLDRAASLLEEGDDAGALEALLVAWRAAPSERVADLLDVLSARLASARGPIAGKTKADRRKRWMDLASKTDAADLGRLLAARWLPERWQDAMPLVESLVAWPIDPRVALAFARVVDAVPYDTMTSRTFFRALLARVAEIGDVRALRVLGQRQETERPFRYRLDVAATERAVVAALRKQAARATPARHDEAALARIETALAGTSTARVQTQRRADALLETIYASPDDDAPRLVYADLLAEAGEGPRAELIGLQIARAASPDTFTPAMARREKELLDAHADAWAGAPGRRLDPTGRVFERGFVAGGVLRPREPGGAPIFDDPAWATVRAIEVGRRADGDAVIAELSGAASLRGLRAVHGLSARQALKCLTASVARIDEVGVVGAPDEDLTALLDARGLARLRRLSIAGGAGGLAAWARALAKNTASLETFVYHAERQASFTCPSGLRFTLSGREGGRLRSLFVELFPTKLRARDVLATLEQGLAALVPLGLRSITIAPSRALKPDAWDRDRLDAALARHGARIEVPWRQVAAERRAAEEDVLPASGETMTLLLEVEGDRPIRDLRGLLASLDDAGLRLGFDVFSVGGGAERAIAGDLDRVVARVEKAFPKGPRGAGRSFTVEVQLRRDVLEGRRSLKLRSWGSSTELEIESDGFDTPEGVARWRAWLEGVLARWHVRHGACSEIASRVGGPRPLSWLEDTTPDLAWITILGAHHEPMLPRKEVERAAKRLGGTVLATKRNLLVAWSAAPMPPADVAAISAALVPIFFASFRRVHGYDLAARIDAVLGPTLERLGMKRDAADADEDVTHRFAVVHGAFLRAFEIGARRFLGKPVLSARLALNAFADGRRGPYLTGAGLANAAHADGDWPAASRAEVDASLRAIAARLDAEAERIFSSREKKETAALSRWNKNASGAPR